MFKLGLSLMPESDFLAASKKLFDSGSVDVLEWSFDMAWGTTMPSRCAALLQEYSSQKCLYGHGVSYSILTAKQTERQQAWLEYFQKEISTLQYNAISEHFGFISTDKHTRGAPLPMPYNKSLLKLAVNRLKQLQAIAKIPIGLENLGFAFSQHDVLQQGQFITELLEATNGYLVLDLHNLYCHMKNFDMSFQAVLETLPIHRAKEIHVSGGKWREVIYEDQNIRCDSHDDEIPEDIYGYLEHILRQLPQIEIVIYERIGNTLNNKKEIDAYINDYYQLQNIVNKINHEQRNAIAL